VTILGRAAIDLGEPSRSAKPASLCALYALAQLLTDEPDAAAALRRAARLAADGADCAFAALIVGRGTERGVYGDGGVESLDDVSRMLGMARLSLLTEALDAGKPVTVAASDGLAWAAVSLPSDLGPTGAVIVANPKDGSQAIDLDFLSAVATFLSPVADRVVGSRLTKDDFLSMAGHELRTPITSIRGLSQLMARRWDRLEPRAIADALQTIIDQTEQMSGLVDDLLDVSRIQTGGMSLRLSAVDLAPLLHSAVDRQSPQRPGAVRLKMNRSLLVSGDANRLTQVFSNLLDNALKYSDPRSPIDVDASKQGSFVQVAFRDRGIGVPPEALGRLFERFYRAENATAQAGGLGLGLYICREIVMQHGGRIDVECQAGEGATFTVILPLLQGGDAHG